MTFSGECAEAVLVLRNREELPRLEKYCDLGLILSTSEMLVCELALR